ncbi:hypothetical protein DFQ28_010616 [Apophysomyces sp. BC1034]|nr:hypothetical protein DFQ30_010266 [Apophysomyces sp. BC1015]KAG0181494.1 hypothetical protein DFQ29_008163 [Apophysomyces sp. BC1021]KAG0191925.1 hypothetical protein DFQ28_010616 [Apophysomyces sp. BC1034]
MINEGVEHIRATHEAQQSILEDLGSYKAFLHRRGAILEQAWKDVREHAISITQTSHHQAEEDTD